ncbi:MAG: amino acid--tRNA ligase-related protein, partial [Candidatus Poribacteria bacterium]|nr:amino acid--tRNA ligase-related protein [Candidatus Poribacteria bacterium]
SDLVAYCDFKVFSSVVSNCGQVKGLAVPDGANQFSRRDIDELTNLVAVYQAKGLAWIKVTEDGFDSGIVKFFTEETLNAIAERMKATRGDLMLFVADTPKVVADSLSNLRLHLGRSLDLIDHNRYDFLWVVDFPLFEWNAEEDRYEPAHHLFTAPSDDSIPLLDTDPGKAQSQHYDLVINGNEVASGSVRIHRWEIQQKILEHLNISPEEVKSRFGYFIEALQYGTPPHAGIAPGLDRLVMIMLGEENIREVIAFPKTQRGACLMTGAPSDVTDFQLEELSIKIDA